MTVHALISKVVSEAKLSGSSIHGVHHWQTVERNGVYLCQFNAADEEVVRLFALFHDSMRLNEGSDPEHGLRAAHYIKTIVEQIFLKPKQIDNLCTACLTHTHGSEAPNETVGTCWDADRLDLRRVGIQPHADYLTTEEAKRVATERDYASLYKFTFSSIFLDKRPE